MDRQAGFLIKYEMEEKPFVCWKKTRGRQLETLSQVWTQDPENFHEEDKSLVTAW